MIIMMVLLINFVFLQKLEYEGIESYKTQIINVLQDIMEIITQDVMTNGRG